MNSKSVFIIILAWNHKDDTREALRSFLQDTYSNKKIVVVDNASSDGTSDMIRSEFETIEILRSEENLGVSGGYNLGIDFAVSQNADYILIANNDIVTDKNMISGLVETLEKYPNAGYRDWETDRKSTRLNSSHITRTRMPSSA